MAELWVPVKMEAVNSSAFLPAFVLMERPSHPLSSTRANLLLQDSWVEELNENDEAYFAASKNGWSCDSLGLQWLDRVFERHTKGKAGNRRRLLLVDGHSSHVNMKFIDYADQKRILIMVLPPHSTH